MSVRPLDWGDLFDDLASSPVRQPDWELAADEGFYRDLADSCEVLAARFKGLVDDPRTQFLGRAAEAFTDLTLELTTRIEEIPDRLRLVAGALGGYRRDLDDLRVRADAAFARAVAQWDRVADERRRVQRAEAARRVVEQQLDLGAGHPDGGWSADAMVAEADRRLSAAGVGLRAAERDLDAFRHEYWELDGLVGDAEARARMTIDDVDLGALADPSLLDRAWDYTGGLVVGLAGDLVEGLEAMAVGLIEGDWRAVLAGVAQVLDVAIVVAATVAIVCSGGALAAVVLGLAVAKLAVDSVMMATGTTDLDGNDVGWDTIAMDALGVGAAGIAFARPLAGAARGGRPGVLGRVRSVFATESATPLRLEPFHSIEGLKRPGVEFIVADARGETLLQAAPHVVRSVARTVPGAVGDVLTLDTLGTAAVGYADGVGIDPRVTLLREAIVPGEVPVLRAQVAQLESAPAGPPRPGDARVLVAPSS